MSEISPELKRALDTIARLATRRRADDACAQSNPTKTREEAEAFLSENPTAAHRRILDFIYGKAGYGGAGMIISRDELKQALFFRELTGNWPWHAERPRPIKTRKEAEAFIRELNEKYDVYYKAYEELLDFIYG